MKLTFRDPEEAFHALIEQKLITDQRHKEFCLLQIEKVTQEAYERIEYLNNKYKWLKKLFRIKPIPFPTEWNDICKEYMNKYGMFYWGLPYDSNIKNLLEKSETYRKELETIYDQMNNRGRNFSVTLDAAGWRIYVPEFVELG